MSEPIKTMKTIWFCGEDENVLTSIAEIVGEEMINRNQNVEIIVHSEIEDILGSELKDMKDGKSIFTDRLAYLGHLLHRNGTFALIVSKDSSVEDRKKAKENFGNYMQINVGSFKDMLCDLDLNTKDTPKINAKKVIDYLTLERIMPARPGSSVYSKEEEEEIRKRLEDLGYV